MADFMRIKYENPKKKQSEIPSQLNHSTSTLPRYRNDIKMPSPYSIQPNNTNKRSKKVSITNLENKLHRENDLKRPQMTSNDFVKLDTNTRTNQKNKNISKLGSIQENIEIYKRYLHKILHKKNS